MNLDIIFAKTKCEVWKDRLRDGECSFGEFNNVMNKSIKELKNG